MPNEFPDLPEGVTEGQFQKLAEAAALRGFEDTLTQRGYGYLLDDEKTAEQSLKVAVELYEQYEEQEEVLQPMRKQAARETLRALDQNLSA